MNQQEVEAFFAFAAARRLLQNAHIPIADLPRGGIVGCANIIDCVSESRDTWFEGKYGFVLANVEPLPFTPVRGALRIFEVRERFLGTV